MPLSVTALWHQQLRFLFFSTIALLTISCSQLPEPPSSLTTQESCDALSSKLTNILTLDKSPVIIKRQDLPAFCQVKGLLDNTINIEMRLPTEDWNGKFLMAGCGGFCGSLLADKPGHSNSINESLKLGFAVIAQDGGHTAPSNETAWAYKNPVALELYAHRVIPKVVAASNKIIHAFYNKEPSRKYFSGCSNGGRLGFMAAQRYPKLFDGIAAGGSIFDLSGNAGVHGAWLVQNTLDNNWQPRVPQLKLPLLASHVMSQCDAVDGLTDGIITDPRACKVDFTDIQCQEQESASCFTMDQLSSIKALYQGATDSNGKSLYPGITYGSEYYWPLWIYGTQDNPAWGPLATQGYHNLYQNMPPGQTADIFAINLDTFSQQAGHSELAKLSDAVDTDLSALEKAGAKLLIWHGWADPLILPEPVIEYYEKVVAAAGGVTNTQKFSRLFMLPMHGHCWEMPPEAPDSFNPVMILDQWVEKDEAPNQIRVEQRNKKGEIVRSRPVCAYPQQAVYSGTGRIDDAENFYCH